jgi:hypothetical protein
MHMYSKPFKVFFIPAFCCQQQNCIINIFKHLFLQNIPFVRINIYTVGKTDVVEMKKILFKITVLFSK